MVCSACRQKAEELPVGESALYTMQYILSVEIGKLYTFAVSEEVLHTLEMLLSRYFSIYISHKFKSLDILKTIQG